MIKPFLKSMVGEGIATQLDNLKLLHLATTYMQLLKSYGDLGHLSGNTAELARDGDVINAHTASSVDRVSTSPGHQQPEASQYCEKSFNDA